MSDDAFLAQITFPELRAKYQKEIKRQLRKVQRDFQAEWNNLGEERRKQIDISMEHDQVISGCVSAFADDSFRPSQLGYKFLRAAPLLELDVRNFDFLVYKREGNRPIAIFGEAKSSVTNYSHVLNEMTDRRELVESRIDYIKSEYLKENVNPICEYVLAVKSGEASRLREAILDSGQELILWSVDFWNQKLMMEGAPSQEPKRRMMSHHDPSLTSLLAAGTPTSLAAFGFYPQSHPVAKLKSLLSCMEESKSGLIVPLYQVRRFIDKQLFYLNEKQKSRLITEISDLAKRIGFAALSDERPELRLTTRHRRRSSLEEEITHKWIRSQLDEELSKRKSAATEEVREVILAEQRRQPTLF